jgi:hypothetical protein
MCNGSFLKGDVLEIASFGCLFNGSALSFKAFAAIMENEFGVLN